MREMLTTSTSLRLFWFLQAGSRPRGGLSNTGRMNFTFQRVPPDQGERS